MLRRPDGRRWLMVGEVDARGRAVRTSALVFFGRGGPVILDSARPVLLEVPDHATGYDVRRNGSGTTGTLFTKVYVADD